MQIYKYITSPELCVSAIHQTKNPKKELACSHIIQLACTHIITQNINPRISSRRDF